MDDQMIEAVLPISNRESVRQHIDRAKLLLETLDFFWSDELNLKLHVIAPNDEIGAIEMAIGKFGIRSKIEINFLSETDLAPLIGSADSKLGYAKQMLVKMAAFEIVKSPFFIIFDTDIISCRAFDHSTFVVDGRVISSWETPTLHAWWFESARVAGVQMSARYLSQPRLGVTPQLLSCEVLRQVTSYLTRKFEEHWITGLLSRYTGKHPNIWTEYTLYDLIANELGLIEKFHVPWNEISQSSVVSRSDLSLWKADDFERWDPIALVTKPDMGHFSVIQSITANDLDFQIVRKKWINAAKTVFPHYPN